MFMDTCLVASKRKYRIPRIHHLGNPRIVDLEVLECRLRNHSLNAQEYNHTNVTIIRI
jgi:hypothetical protein